MQWGAWFGRGLGWIGGLFGVRLKRWGRQENGPIQKAKPERV